MAVRRATEADIPFIMATERLPGYDQLLGHWTAEAHLAALDSPGAAYFMAEADGAPVGFSMVLGWDAHDRVAQLKRIAVTAPGQGRGRALLAAVMRAVFTQSLTHRLWLTVYPHNIRARRVYEALGFAGEGIARGAAFYGGQHRDTSVMAVLRPEWEAGCST